MDWTSISHVVSGLGHYLLPLLLVCIRTFAMVQLFPLFFWLKLTNFMRLSLALALIMPNFLSMHAELATVNTLSAPVFLWLAMKEALLGAALGILIGLPFWACQAIGDIVELYRGANVANVGDPINASQTSVLGQAMLLIALGLFVVVDGLLVLAKLHVLSFGVWPVLSTRPSLEMATIMTFARGMTQLMELGLLMAAPLMIVMFFCELATAFSGRGSKLSSLNDISSTFKNLVLVVLMPSYMLFISQYIRSHSFEPVMDYLRLLSVARP